MSPPKDPIKFEQWRVKQSIAHMGQIQSVETRQKRSLALSGRTREMSPEWKDKIVAANKKKATTQEFKDNFKIAMKKRSLNPIWRQKVAEKGAMVQLNPEWRTNYLQGIKKRSDNPNWRDNISKGRMGKFCGIENPNWNNGSSFEPYCPKFNKEFKERVRAYFGHVCLECGTPQNDEKLHIHHVNFDKMSCCNDVIPLFVPLCRSCHTKTMFDREYWEQYFTDMIDTYYEGKCYFTKEEMAIS